MENYEKLLAELLSQEDELQFDTFGNEDAISIGQAILTEAKNENLPIAVDISRAGQILFHASMPGTSPDNDQWIARKNRTVMRFHHSSYYIGRKLAQEESTLEEKHIISEVDYACHGGAFPVRLKNTGVIGTVTVSGLAQEEDHALVVKILRNWLKSGK